jgi:hypothetical protein
MTAAAVVTDATVIPTVTVASRRPGSEAAQ